MQPDWKPIATAPRKPTSFGRGPRIMIATTHGGFPRVFFGHWNKHTKLFYDEAAESCVSSSLSATEDMWAPVPLHPAEAQ